MYLVKYKCEENRIPDKMPQIRHGQNATKRKPDKMPQNKNHQNCNNKSYNSVAKV